MDRTYPDTGIDFRLTAGIVLLEAQADGERGHMALDTGAMRTALHTKYFPHLQGRPLEVARFSGQVESAGAGETVLDRLEIPPVVLRDLPVLRMDFDYVEAGLRQVDPALRFLGTLGMDVLRDVSLLIDYGAGRLTLDPVLDTAGAVRVPLRMEALPVVELEVAGTPRPFVLDTGANTCLLAEALRPEIPAVPLPDAPGVSVIPSVALAGVRCQDVAAVFTDLSQIQSVVPVDGVIGYQILSRCRPLLDLPHGTLYLLEP